MKDRIKSVRKYSSMTQSEFGEKIGVSRDVIANIEYGRVEPSQVITKSICREFDVNEQWLRTGEGEMFRPKDRDAELAYWVGTVMADEPESFRRRFLNLLVNLTPEDWQRAETFTRSLLSQDRIPQNESPDPQADPCAVPSETD